MNLKNSKIVLLLKFINTKIWFKYSDCHLQGSAIHNACQTLIHAYVFDKVKKKKKSLSRIFIKILMIVMVTLMMLSLLLVLMLKKMIITMKVVKMKLLKMIMMMMMMMRMMMMMMMMMTVMVMKIKIMTFLSASF